MCGGGGSQPSPAPTPAPAPPPPVEGPRAPELNETKANDRNRSTSMRRGRGSLRINLAQSGTGEASARPSGLNIAT